jgi:hypothetical protein
MHPFEQYLVNKANKYGLSISQDGDKLSIKRAKKSIILENVKPNASLVDVFLRVCLDYYTIRSGKASPVTKDRGSLYNILFGENAAFHLPVVYVYDEHRRHSTFEVIRSAILSDIKKQDVAAV